MNRNKKKTAAIVLAGCLVTTSVAPAYAANGDQITESSENTVKISLNDGLHRENVTDVQSSDPNYTVSWNAEEQVFEISAAEGAAPMLTITWRDEFSPDEMPDGSHGMSSLSLGNLGGGFTVSPLTTVDKLNSTIKVQDEKVVVTLAGGSTQEGGTPGANVILRKANIDDFVEDSEFCAFGNEVELLPSEDGMYDIFAETRDGSGVWKLGTVTVSDIVDDADKVMADQLHFTQIDLSLGQGSYNGFLFDSNFGEVDGFSGDKLKLSSTQDKLTEIPGSSVEYSDICFISIPESAGVDASKEPVYLFYGTALIGQLNNVEAGETPDTGDGEDGEEKPPVSEATLSLEAGSQLVLSYASSDPSDQDTAADTIIVKSSQALENTPIGNDFSFAKDEAGAIPAPGIQVSGVTDEGGNRYSVSVSSTYGSSKGLSEICMFYKGTYIGKMSVSNILATKTVVTLGEDKEINLVFEHGAAADARMADSIDISSNAPVSSGKFSLKSGDQILSDVNFIVTSEKLNITCRRDVTPGVYDLYYDGELIGQVTISVTEKEEEAQTEISVADAYIDFDYPHYVQDGDSAEAVLKIRVQNPKEDLVLEKFSLAGEAGSNQLSGLVKNEDGTYSLTVSHVYNSSESNLLTMDVLYDGQKIGTVTLSMTVAPNNDGMIVNEVHDMLASVQGEDAAAGTPPSATLPYSADYENDKAAQAAALQPKMQAWIDDVAANYGFSYWTGAKIEFTYDQELNQFKSVVKLRDAVSSAKVWNVTVEAKPIPDEKPSVDLSSINLMEGSTQKITASLGSGKSAATKATISVGNSNMISVNTTELNAENLADGLVVSGLKSGSTYVDIVFDDEAQTSFHIPVVINAKTFTINASVNNEEYGSIKSSILNFDGTIESGQSITFTFEPKEGYKVEEILVDNVKTQVQNNQYTFNNVQENHTIFVQFAEDETEENVLPKVSVNSMEITEGKNGSFTVSLGSGLHKADTATIVVKDPSIATVSRNTVTAENVGNGITVTGLKAGTTDILISFNNENKSTIEIPVTIKSKSTSSGGSSSSGGGSSSSSTSKKPTVKHNSGGTVTVMSNNRTIVITPNSGYRIKEVIANGKNVGAVSRYEFKTASRSNKIEVVFEKISEAINPPVDTGDSDYVCPFTDISGHWAEPMIKAFAETGWVAGVSRTVFAPNLNMTRGMFVTILGRMDGADTTKYSHFVDVSPKSYYSHYVAWAYANGITNGVDGSHFMPDRNISRQEMAVMICRYLEYKGETLDKTPYTFADSSQIGDWAKSSVYALANRGVVAGKGGNLFDPNASATRAELVTVLYRVAVMMGMLH